MEKHQQLEHLLKQALSSTAEPSEALNQKIKNNAKEKQTMKPARKKMSVALLAAALTLVMSLSAYAASQFLSPRQVAEHLQDQTLAKAFAAENAIPINQSAASGDYTFTLLGITSGQNLSDFRGSAAEIRPDRTYAVVAIARTDGSPLPKPGEESYGQTPFIASPLIKGQKPWQVNIFSMNGSAQTSVIDGIMYRIIECDSLEMFADRGVYLYIGTGSFINNQNVNYNEESGEITANANSKEAHALFDLPLDVKKADPAQAEEYLNELLNPAPVPRTAQEPLPDWDREFAGGIVIAESVKEVTYDENGRACYDYGGGSLRITPDSLFPAGETGVWKVVSVSVAGNEETAVQFAQDEKGVITGRTVKKAE